MGNKRVTKFLVAKFLAAQPFVKIPAPLRTIVKVSRRLGIAVRLKALSNFGTATW
jgi:hypothetical protein